MITYTKAFCLLRLEPNLPRQVLRLVARSCTVSQDVPGEEFGSEWSAGVSRGVSHPNHRRRASVSEGRKLVAPGMLIRAADGNRLPVSLSAKVR
jgi:hypothetical protein